MYPTMKCPICGSINLSIEKRLDGNVICSQCHHSGKRKEFEVTQCGTNIIVTDEILKMKLEPVMLSFHNFDVKIENSVLLLENLFRYYVFKTNMNGNGQFSYHFIYENNIPGESINNTEDRLQAEYAGVVNAIESIIIKK